MSGAQELFVRWAELVLHSVVRLLVHVVYRFRKLGVHTVPRQGAALLVCNHVSFADAVIVAAAFGRPVRFVMDHRIYKAPALHWIFRIAGVIPIAPRNEDPELYAQAFPLIAAALAKGELVCIFPEGRITKDGQLNTFRAGVDRIIAHSTAPVIPMALCGLWGSFFSRKHGPAMSRLPRRFWSRIQLRCGAALTPAQANAQVLQDKVAELANPDRTRGRLASAA